MAGNDLMQLFYETINAQAQQQLGNLLHGTITPIELGSQGDFPWFWQDAEGNFNANTFDYLSRRATPGQHGGVALGDSFLDAYAESLQDLAWKLSADDQQLLNKTQLAATVQAGAVVSAYEQTMGAITPDQIATAAKTLGYTPRKVDFVIAYAVGFQWSGQSLKTGAAPLSYQTLASARNLTSLLPAMPPTAGSILPAVVNYLQVTNSIVSLQDSSSNAMWMRAQLLANTQTPTLANGGVTTITSGGATAVRPGYNINMAPADILNSLSNTGSSLTVTMNAARQDASTLSVDIEGHTGFTLPLDFIGIRVGASAQYSLFEANGSGASATVSMTFPGLTVVPMAPNTWQQDTSSGGQTVGWFYKTPIAQAAAASGKTGWVFSPVPPYNFAPGGDFGWLSALVVSGYPTITIEYSQGDYSEFSKTFAQHFEAEVSLFGIPLGGGSESTFSGQSSSKSTDGTFTITLTPPAQTSTVNAFDQRAYVLGGQVVYAGAAATGRVGAVAPKLALAHSAIDASDAVRVGGTAMVRLAGVSFINRTGFAAQLFTMYQQHGTATNLAAWQTSPALNGTLMTVDVVHPSTRYSYDISRWLPNGVLVSAESPYRLAQVIGRDGRTLELTISDKDGTLVGSFKPAAMAA